VVTMGNSVGKTAPSELNAAAPAQSLSAAQKVSPEARPEINSARAHNKASDRLDVNFVSSQREHPGRVRTPAVAAARPGRKRPLRHGDPELRLKVEGLNGFAAMMATMKEMGYESDEDEEAAAGVKDVNVEVGDDQPTGAVPSAEVKSVAQSNPNVTAPQHQISSVEAGPAAARSRTHKWVIALIMLIMLACVAAIVVVLVMFVGNEPRRRLCRYRALIIQSLPVV